MNAFDRQPNQPWLWSNTFNSFLPRNQEKFDPKTFIIASVIGALFSILGGLMTCRHRQLMKVKLGWIYQAEEHLGLIKTPGNEKEGIIPEDAKMKAPIEWKGLAFPRILSTSGIILFFYLILLAIDILTLIAFSFQLNY